MDGTAITAISGGQVDFRHDELRAGWGAASTAAFTGLIRNAFSESAQPVRLPPRGSRTVISVMFPRQRKAVSEPLLVTGRNRAGDLYEVVYLDPEQVCFRQDHWGAGIVRTSRPFKVNPDVPHRIVFDFASLNPGGTQPDGAQNGVLNMTIDGQRVWEKDAPCNPFKENEVYLGRNDIGGSTCAREFSGEIISCDTNPHSGPPE